MQEAKKAAAAAKTAAPAEEQTRTGATVEEIKNEEESKEPTAE